MKPQVDYSLYLVTDSTEAILGSRDLVEVVEQALRGGWLFSFLCIKYPTTYLLKPITSLQAHDMNVH